LSKYFSEDLLFSEVHHHHEEHIIKLPHFAELPLSTNFNEAIEGNQFENFVFVYIHYKMLG